LEAAPIDQAQGMKWQGEKNEDTGAKGISIGTGKSNTLKIIEVHEKAKYAAKVCSDYRGGGKHDWFLPSIGELKEMHTILYLNHIGGFSENDYWSSIEYDKEHAYALEFPTGEKRTGYYKWADHFYIRAIRTF
jgi:hypothetical protein